MKFDELEEYKKDLTGLLKTYRTLNDDIKVAKQVLVIMPDKRPPFSFRLENLGIEIYVIKVKKLPVKHLKGEG